MDHQDQPRLRVVGDTSAQQSATQEPSISSSQPWEGMTIPLGKLSMDRQRELINRLFERMSVLYGSSFTHQWSGYMDNAEKLSVLRTSWRQEMAPFSPQEILLAFADMKAAFGLPPTIPQFSALCRARRRPTLMAALPAPEPVDEDALAMFREFAERLKRGDPLATADVTAPGDTPFYKRQWARDIVALDARGEYKGGPAGVAIARVALGSKRYE